MPPRAVAVKLSHMRRPLIILALLFAICLQSSPMLFAAAPQMASECQSNSEISSDKSCCPTGVHIASCCLDACMMAANVSLGSIPMIWNGHSALIPQFEVSAFSSRGDSPLTRPPIL